MDTSPISTIFFSPKPLLALQLGQCPGCGGYLPRVQRGEPRSQLLQRGVEGAGAASKWAKCHGNPWKTKEFMVGISWNMMGVC
jgi:uncharacterized protein with PIN domain